MEHISKEFFDGQSWQTVIKDISFDIVTQEFTVIAGPSGSGKTTLLTIMGLILSPTSGTLVVNNQPVNAFSEDELATLRMKNFGFVRLDLGASMTSSECLVEMEAPNGARMRMSFKGVPRDFDSVELSRVFWRQG
jgi:ABC-type lipoprotein export system ATPase subunit